MVCGALYLNQNTVLIERLKLFFITGDLNTLLNYETAAQRHNLPVMLGVDGIQKVYGSNNCLIPPALTTLVRNVGIAFCQSAKPMKVCVIFKY